MKSNFKRVAFIIVFVVSIFFLAHYLKTEKGKIETLPGNPNGHHKPLQTEIKPQKGDTDIGLGYSFSNEFGDTETVQTIRAFPGAEGFGAMSRGGRGGRVIEVTNLNASGPGSFKAACLAEGPRTIIFKVGGNIPINDRITIKEPYVTIAGQTAPGDGICLSGGTLAIITHDVIVRYLRIRVGDSPLGPSPGNRDAIDIAGTQDLPAENIMVDHCSFSWAIDENAATWFYNNKITFQWCIISEGLQYSLHPQGPHSKGMILGSEESSTTVHHCLFAHNWDRSPLMGNIDSEPIENSSIYDIRYNIFYNHGKYACSRVNGNSNVNYVGNYIIMGEDGNPKEIKGLAYSGAEGQKIYVENNVWPEMEDWADDWGVVGYKLLPGKTVVPDDLKSEEPFPAPEITDLEDNYDAVLRFCGATVPKRDPVDERIIDDVIFLTGCIIDSQAEVGGWPVYETGDAPADTDHDGMPDVWEKEFGFNENDPDDGINDYDRDGYTNLEEFLNNTDPIGQLKPYRIDML